MTGRHRARAARRRAGLDLGTLPRRAAAQAVPLALVAVLVALVVALAAAVPRAVARVSDAAVRTAVARAGADADLVVTTPTAFTETGQGYDGSAELAREAADQIGAGLAPPLGDVLRAPVVSTATAPLGLAVDADGPAAPTGEVTLRLVWTPVEGAVTWVSGAEPVVPPAVPAPGADGGDGDASAPAPPEPVQVGLSEAVARAVGATTGDPLHLTASDGGPVEAVVSGLFRPEDPDAATWHDAPDLLDPRVSTTGPATTTDAAALLSDDSLGAAVAAVGPREVQRTVRVALEPARVGVAAGDRLLAELPALQASPGTIGWGASGGSLHSSAVGVLRAAAADLAAARGAATSLVVGGVGVGALLLVLTAGLLARRRAGELATRRTRGAALPALAVELGAEAVVVAGVGALAGVLVAGAVVPGAVPAGAVLALAGLAALALPVAALRVAHGAADPGRRRRGGDRADARAGRRADARGRRLAAELALGALAAGSVVALRAGASSAGAAPGGGTGAARAAGAAEVGSSPDLLAAAAPALLAAVGAVLVARALPALVARLAPLAERSRRAVGVLAVARARSDGLAALPLVAVVTAAALVVVGASAALAVRDGQEAAAWASVGGDARVQGPADPALASAAAAWAREPGVSVAVAARVVRDVPARSAEGSVRVDVVVGEPADLARLAASLPRGGGASPDTGAVSGEVVLRWEGEDRTVHALHVPGLPRPSAGRDAARPVLAVDAAELGGVDAAPPGTVWLVGPGAEAAVRAAPPPDGAEVATRTAALRALRADVLPRALVGAAAASVALLLAFVALAVLVAATAGAPGRRRALDTLRTVGLTDREARRVAAGEVLPTALLATSAGAALGCAVAPLVLGPLGLGVAAGSGPAGSLAWPAAVLPVLVGLAAGAALLQVEHARRRTHRLGEVLRAGG